MSITINASLYATDADDDSDPQPLALTATAANADAAWDELRDQLAKVLGVDTVGDVEAVDDDEDAPAGVERGMIDGHYIEWTITKKAPAKNAIPDGRMSSKAMADAVGTDPRTLRIFLRQSTAYESVGSGARYSFAKSDVAKIKKAFTTWKSADEKTRAARKADKLAASKTEAPKAE